MTKGIIIAATHSGAGKTTIATGLMRALSRTYSVAPFKVGPDYIDPSYHHKATGKPGRNLDSVLCPGIIPQLYAHGAQGSDIAIIEGVMGLFDGMYTPNPGIAPGSTADIASILDVPIILVADCRHIGQSIAALIKGFILESPTPVAGIILNHIASAKHERMCRQALDSVGVPIFGVLPRVGNTSESFSLPSRHLGLVTAGENDDVEASIEAMADMVAVHIDLEAIVCAARTPTCGADDNEGFFIREKENRGFWGQRRIAIAAGKAFSFIYAEHKELLEAYGARLEFFDPLSQELPECDGLIIPGGFPEEYATELSHRGRNAKIAHAIDQGLPVYAECAGLLWLSEAIDAAPMIGIIPAYASIQAPKRKLTLGYRQAVALQDSVVCEQGQRITAHEFHYSSIEYKKESPLWAYMLEDTIGERTTRRSIYEGYGSTHPHIYASYMHIHPAANPMMVRRFIEST